MADDACKCEVSGAQEAFRVKVGVCEHGTILIRFMDKDDQCFGIAPFPLDTAQHLSVNLAKIVAHEKALRTNPKGRA